MGGHYKKKYQECLRNKARKVRALEAIFEGGQSLVLKIHIFKAMLAQHVASELRMRLWTLRSHNDRNTPSRLKIDLGKSGYNGFFSYNGYNGFLVFLTVFRHV